MLYVLNIQGIRNLENLIYNGSLPSAQ